MCTVTDGQRLMPLIVTVTSGMLSINTRMLTNTPETLFLGRVRLARSFGGVSRQTTISVSPLTKPILGPPQPSADHYDLFRLVDDPYERNRNVLA